MNQSNIDFCNYIQPIVTGCAGFVKSDGYMTHIPGLLILMDVAETFCVIIHIPVIYDIYMTAVINTFLSLKEDEDKSNFDKLTYFTGWNIKCQHLTNYYHIFENIDNNAKCIFYEPNCANLKEFSDIASSVDIGHINISDGYNNYRIPVSKAITNITKTDYASLKVYDCGYNNISNVKTIKYTVYKKKFKLSADVYANILMT